MNDLPFKKGDLANTGFQYLEDIATGYWYSEILFSAVELGIFDHIENGETTVSGLAEVLACDADKLLRLLKSMESLSLMININDEWFNCQTASRYLVSNSTEYMGYFILYRKYMRKKWQKLSGKIISHEDTFYEIEREDVEKKFYNYLRATDSQIKIKSLEILEILNRFEWHFPVLDVGGGAGSLLREVIRPDTEKPGGRHIDRSGSSMLFELDDVIKAAKRLYPSKSDWEQFRVVGGDFRIYEFKGDEKFGLIILSNFLHAYGSSEARELLIKACSLLQPDGILLVHDYFPDRIARFPQKGKLYDLNMMINTYNGKCHESREVVDWLEHAEINCTRVFDLKTDTSVIIAHGENFNRSALGGTTRESLYEKMQYQALGMGFQRAVPISADKIVTASWTRLKCRFGCQNYNANLKCPPYGLEHNQTRELLSEYSHALILEGAPPGKEFHNRLLALEKKAFLEGYYKAFIFIAGPCSVCPECPESGECRNPKLARPSMEGSGIDVYSTCKSAGISLSPVAKKGEYVRYIGLLLLG